MNNLRASCPQRPVILQQGVEHSGMQHLGYCAHRELRISHPLDLVGKQTYRTLSDHSAILCQRFQIRRPAGSSLQCCPDYACPCAVQGSDDMFNNGADNVFGISVGPSTKIKLLFNAVRCSA
jgi:hypothetical protein